MRIQISKDALGRQWFKYGVAMAAGAALATVIHTTGGKPAPAGPAASQEGWRGWIQPARAVGTGADTPPDKAAPVDEPAPAATPKAVFDQFLKTTKKVDPVEGVITLVKSDPAFRSELMARYLKGMPVDENIKARFVLSESESADVTRMAVEAARGTDLQQRQRATALLVSMQDSQSGARSYLREALDQESDPQVLAQVMQGLRPQPFMTPKENAAIVDRIKALRDSADPQLQQAALRSLARWEGGQAIEKDVLQGMRSSDPGAVVFSIQTAMQGQLKSDAFKDELFMVVERGDLPVELRKQVVEVLGSTRLNESEYGRLLRVRAQL